jgi:hypothetical protein
VIVVPSRRPRTPGIAAILSVLCCGAMLFLFSIEPSHVKLLAILPPSFMLWSLGLLHGGAPILLLI